MGEMQNRGRWWGVCGMCSLFTHQFDKVGKPKHFFVFWVIFPILGVIYPSTPHNPPSIDSTRIYIFLVHIQFFWRWNSFILLERQPTAFHPVKFTYPIEGLVMALGSRQCHVISSSGKYKARPRTKQIIFRIVLFF